MTVLPIIPFRPFPRVLLKTPTLTSTTSSPCSSITSPPADPPSTSQGWTKTHTHSLWMSNLFVDLTRMGPNPTLRSYDSYLSAAFTDHRCMVSNTLLVWHMFLGGHVEETVWAVDKSCAVVSSPSSSSIRLTLCAPVTRWKPSSLTCLQK